MDDNERARHEALRTIQQFRDFANLCGCGPSIQLLQVIWDGLEATPEPGLAGRDRDGLDVDERADMLLAYTFDAWELTEHGTSLAGAWLTADGVRLRDAMRLVDLVMFHEEMDDRWWVVEYRLHPNGYYNDGVQQVGDWRPRKKLAPAVGDSDYPDRTAPPHVVDNLLAVMRPHRGPRVGSAEYAKSARAEAQTYADRWWAEAFARGATWGLERAPTRIVLSPGQVRVRGEVVEVEHHGQGLFQALNQQPASSPEQDGGTDAVG